MTVLKIAFLLGLAGMLGVTVASFLGASAAVEPLSRGM
jgi:hypothetical protein